MEIGAKRRQAEKTYFFGKSHTMETKKKITLAKSIHIKVPNVKTNDTTIFASNL